MTSMGTMPSILPAAPAINMLGKGVGRLMSKAIWPSRIRSRMSSSTSAVRNLTCRLAIVR